VSTPGCKANFATLPNTIPRKQTTQTFSKIMKKLLYSFLALGLITTASCKDDDGAPEPAPIANNSVAYNGTSYSIDNGAIIDWGTDGEHYNYDIFLADGEIDFETNTATGASIIVYAELFSPGDSDFSAGTFIYNASGNVSGKYYFEMLQVMTDSNNNRRLDEHDEILNVTGGKVTTTGKPSNFSMELDVTLDNGKTLKGNYSGSYDYYDGTGGGGERVGKSAKRGLR
jgi:hypothetical protein